MLSAARFAINLKGINYYKFKDKKKNDESFNFDITEEERNYFNSLTKVPEYISPLVVEKINDDKKVVEPTFESPYVQTTKKSKKVSNRINKFKPVKTKLLRLLNHLKVD